MRAEELHLSGALLAKKIYKEFSFVKFLIIMLAFDDYDFQTLVLDEKENKREEENKIKNSELVCGNPKKKLTLSQHSWQ